MFGSQRSVLILFYGIPPPHTNAVHTFDQMMAVAFSEGQGLIHEDSVQVSEMEPE